MISYDTRTRKKVSLLLQQPPGNLAVIRPLEPSPAGPVNVGMQVSFGLFDKQLKLRLSTQHQILPKGIDIAQQL